jgi:hypothetical protein
MNLYTIVFSLPLWKRAGEALAECKRLVVIGYSFSSTDFRTKKLFLESFSSNNLQELIVVNPHKSIVETAEKLCHFKNAKVFPDLTSYMRQFMQEEIKVRALESMNGLSSIFAEGRRVVEALDHAGFALPGAFWLLSTNRGPWTLFLVSPAVELEGKQETLMKVRAILSSVQPPLKIEVGAVTMLSPNDGLANIMKGFLRTGLGISGARLSHSIINGFKIEDSYVYRMQ